MQHDTSCLLGLLKLPTFFQGGVTSAAMSGWLYWPAGRLFDTTEMEIYFAYERLPSIRFQFIKNAVTLTQLAAKIKFVCGQLLNPSFIADTYTLW